MALRPATDRDQSRGVLGCDHEALPVRVQYEVKVISAFHMLGGPAMA